MSGVRGPQALRSPLPANVAAQDRKLHQLEVPARTGVSQALAGDATGSNTSHTGSSSLGVGPSTTSWDDREVARQIALLTEERDFLRKYVSRCEHELKAYQLQYPDLVAGHTAGGGHDLLNELSGSVEELPPWIGQAKYMSPLLVAYEARIEELMEKNQEQMHDFATLKSQYDDLYKRNTEAEAELESNIKNLLTHMDQQKGGKGAGAKSALLDEDEVNELQEQVQLYKEQLDIVNSQKLELEQEVVKLTKNIDVAKNDRDTFWSAELKKLQTTLSQLRLERDKFKNSSQTLQQAQLDLSSLQKEHAALQKKFLNTQVTLESTEKDLDVALDKEKASASNLVHAERDLEALLKTMQQMEKEAQDAKGREIAAIKRESEYVSRSEAAKLEKDQALQRENAAAKEVARLEEKLNYELAAAGRKHEEELAALYEKGKETEARLQAELSNAGLVIAESEVARERAQRESTQSRAAADQLAATFHAQLSETKEALGQCESHLAEQSHEVESLRSRLSRAESELTRATEFFAKEKTAGHEHAQNLKLKNESLLLANQHLTAQVTRLTDSFQRLEKEHNELRRVSDNSIKKLQSQLNELENQRKMQTDELKMRLEEAYRMHEQSEARSTELLAAQDVLSAKWREENAHVRESLSKLLSAEKATTSKLHQRLAEIEARISQVIRERDAAMAFEAQYELLKKSHETTVADLTQRSSILTGELSAYAAREPEYLLQQKTLQGKLDRAEIEIKRLNRSYEAARKKIEFLENHHPNAAANTHVLQPSALANQQQSSNAKSTFQPLPIAAALLPPSFKKL